MNKLKDKENEQNVINNILMEHTNKNDQVISYEPNSRYEISFDEINAGWSFEV